ncbi:MAG: hypothetical protein IJN56_06785 [Clostridia bacterium]|nr:hypothetical protein [Clostridia bacterium]
MGLFFDIIHLASYFLILIVFLTIAIILAKKLSAWIWYSIGAIITLISLIGQHISCYNYYESFYLTNDEMSPYWSFYIVSLLISALIIFYRYSTSKSDIEGLDDGESKKSKFSETLSKVPSSTSGKTWECKKCGSKNSQNSIHCKNCGEYK